MNTVHPELVRELKEHAFPDSGKIGPAATGLQLRAARATQLAGLRHFCPIPGPIPDAVRETEHLVQIRGGIEIRIIIYTPAKAPATGSPLTAMFHEGGWCMGDLTDEALNYRTFSHDLGAICVNVEYRLAPEAPFPTGVNDSWDVLKLETGLIVDGASAGGNISADLCQIGRVEGLQPPLTGQYLCVPALLSLEGVLEKLKAQYRSCAQAESDLILKLAKPGSTSGMVTALKPDPLSPLFGPLLHQNLGGLSAAFSTFAGPILRRIYDGFGQMFWTNWPLMNRSMGFVNETLAGVQWLVKVGAQKNL